MNRSQKILVSTLILTVSASSVYSWNGLVAENGDILGIVKWNELLTLINSKIDRTNIIAGHSIAVTSSGSDVIISAGQLSSITTNRDDADINATRYYGVEYSDNTWRIDKETGTGTGIVRTEANPTNNASYSTNYPGAWTNRSALAY